MIKCLPSFVNSLPPADLQETSLALDLGGTNFRVCSVVMDRGNVNLDQEKFQIPPSAKETSDAMFDFLAGCVKTYVDKRNLVEKRQNELNLGFTFSFPVGTSHCRNRNR